MCFVSFIINLHVMSANKGFFLSLFLICGMHKFSKSSRITVTAYRFSDSRRLLYFTCVIFYGVIRGIARVILSVCLSVCYARAS